MNAELIEGIGEAIAWSFGILEALGNGFNWFLIAVITVMTFGWIRKMISFKSEAKQNGTLE